ncbi:MAG: hypothetical protein GY757_10490 [bacterium]|nr:hypothetical protein [bacterium]
MSTPYYYVLILIDESTDFSLTGLKEKLEEKINDFKFRVSAHELIASKGDWELVLSDSNESHVIIESKELAELHPDWPNIERVKVCRRRLELSSWADDSSMDHFNTYVLILEIIHKFSGVLLAFDPRDGKII